MKNTMLMLLALFVGSAMHAQLSLGPQLQSKSYVVDYGTIKQGSEKARVWQFNNSGSQPLLITSTEGSCGCTVPSKPDRPIPPGGKGEIKIEYDTQRIGEFSKTVKVVTNEVEGKDAAGQPIYRVHEITIKGKVVQ
jgi:hypothetical protein